MAGVVKPFTSISTKSVGCCFSFRSIPTAAKLGSFDPKTGAMEDLGRMHPTEMYARSLAIGPNGKVYVGIGTEKGDLVVFDPSTGQHRSIQPKALQGAKGWSTVGVSRRVGGQVYAV